MESTHLTLHDDKPSLKTKTFLQKVSQEVLGSGLLFRQKGLRYRGAFPAPQPAQQEAPEPCFRDTAWTRQCPEAPRPWEPVLDAGSKRDRPSLRPLAPPNVSNRTGRLPRSPGTPPGSRGERSG